MSCDGLHHDSGDQNDPAILPDVRPLQHLDEREYLHWVRPNFRRQTQSGYGCVFKSIHGTLNHQMIGDMWWMARFLLQPMPGLALNAIIHENFDDLWVARCKLDTEISEFAAGVTQDWLAKTYSFKSLTYNREITNTNWFFVMQLFNHQTHHRGQVTTLMKQCGVDPGPTDLPAMP